MKLRILRIGAVGDDVIELQSAIINLGYKPGAIDGIFGTKTASAVIQFQKDNGLVSDGLVGPITWGKIKSLMTTYESYIIQPGDTFYKIALAKNIALSELLAANPGINPNMLMVGESIQLPPSSIHKCGMAAIQGDYIYYFQFTGTDPVTSTIYTDPKTGAIYKIRRNGSEKVKLVETGVGINPGAGINVVGDWVYYRYSTPVNYSYRDSEGKPTNATAYAGSIYKIRTNGTENTKISDDNAAGIIVINGWIYYSMSKLSLYDTSTQPGIYKIKTDGTGKVKLVEFFESGYIVNIADGFIYYYSNDNGGTNRMTLDGSGKTPIIDGNFMVYGTKDWIYYIYGDFWTDAQIYKTKFDGSQKTLLYNGPAIGNRLIVYGNYVYFAASPNKGIYRVKTDGSELTKISDDYTREFCIADDYIYYYLYDDVNYFNYTNGPIRIKIDGSERTNLAQW